MRKEFDIQSYMTQGVVRVVTDALRATAKNPKEAAFMASFAVASKIASKKRAAIEKQGEHIPPFLIASITSACNLHCAGCYSRANHACCDSQPTDQLTAEPCPFSPYSDINVRDASVREALKSPLFYVVNSEGLLKDEHIGGCTLYMNRDKVEKIMERRKNQSDFAAAIIQ